jgi:hypothetical protein
MANSLIPLYSPDDAVTEIRSISTMKQPRPFGLCAGEFALPDDFDDPLPNDILSAFEDDLLGAWFQNTY